MKRKTKSLITVLAILLPLIICGQQWKKNYPEYLLDKASNVMISEIYNKIKKQLTEKDRKKLGEIDTEFFSSDNFQLIYIETSGSKKNIKINKTRLIELFNLMEIWILFGKDESKTQDIAQLFTKYVDYITYNSNEKLFVPPEVFFKLSNEDFKRINSDFMMGARSSLLEYSLYFLIAHEVAHYLYLHTETSSGISWEEEKQADDFSIKLVNKEYQLTLYTYPIFLYISSLDKRSGNTGYSQSHPNPELRALEVLHKQFEDFDTIDSAIKEYGGPLNYNRKEYYHEMLTAILSLLDYFMLNKSFNEEYHLDKAENGEIYHQMMVGFRYWIGYGKWKENRTKAGFWLKKASEQHDKNAIMLYAMFMEFEFGNIKLAHQLYHEAVDLGNKVPEAQLTLIHELEKVLKIEKLHLDYKMYQEKIDDCMNSCLNYYNNSQEECEKVYCKKHLHNVNSWLISTKRKTIDEK